MAPGDVVHRVTQRVFVGLARADGKVGGDRFLANTRIPPPYRVRGGSGQANECSLVEWFCEAARPLRPELAGVACRRRSCWSVIRLLVREPTGRGQRA